MTKTPEAVGGVSAKQLNLFGDRFAKLKAEADTVRSAQSTLMKEIEDKGVNKPAFKLAMKLRDMEIEKAAEFDRDLANYLQALGVDKRFEAHEQAQQTARDQESAAAASQGNGAEAGAPAGA
jgi:uncharacterized protein (UPF0335 family)